MKQHTASNFLRQLTAFLLALALAVPVGYAHAGDRKLRASSVLTDGLTYYNTITQNASNRIESFSLELSPASAAYPILLQGSGAIYGAGTVSKAVAYAQSLGYHVLGAVNTDFFSTASGVPIGMVIEDGVYKSSPEEEAAMAIVNGQVLLVDNPEVSLTLTNQNTGYQVRPHHLNKWRTPSGGLFLLNQDFSAASTHTSGMGWYVRMRLVDPTQPDIPAAPDGLTAPADPTAPDVPDSAAPQDPVTPEDSAAPDDPAVSEGQPAQETDPIFSGDALAPSQEPVHELPKLTLNSTLTLEVVELLHSDQAVPIGADEYILTASDDSGYISVFQAFQAGDRVTITASCTDPVLSSAQWAGGVGDVIVRNGAITDSGAWTYTNSGRAPRTALGVRADGTLVVYAVDGRQSGYSMGLSEVDLAQEMLAQGCQWAVNVDGGGSTAISVWVPGQEAVSLRNRPSDGVQRACATYLLLVTDDAGDGLPSRLALKEDSLVALAGSRVLLPETAVLDSGLNVLSIQADDLTIASGGLGSVLDGVYTAGPLAGTDTLSLYSPWLAAAGAAQIHIVESLTALTVSREGSTAALSSLAVKPGESVQLAVTGAYWGRTALRDFSAVTWTMEGEPGTVDENGLFTMNEYGSSGSITAHAGGLSQTIQVTTPYTHNDVTREHWAYNSVAYCYSNGIVNGISATAFGPEELVSRADFVLMLYRAAGQPPVAAPCTFTDVAPDAYYASALAWAQSAGLTAGSADGAFRPEDPAIREDAFTILRQVMPLLGKQCPNGSLAELEQFADWDQIADYAQEPIAALVAQGIVNGKGAGMDPKGNLTRAEMATLLHKVLISTPELNDPAGPDQPADPVAPTDPVDPGDPAAPADPVEPAEPAAPTEPADQTGPTDPAAPDQPALPDPAGYALTLDQTEVSLAPAEQTALTAVLTPAFAGAEIVWTSSNPAAAPVTQQGVVTNIHPSEEGTQAVITASWNGLTASCLVQCQPAVFIGTVVNAENGLNVRSGAGTDRPITGSLANGSQVVVVAITKSGWYHIHYLHPDGYAAEGYVSGDYLQLNR